MKTAVSTPAPTTSKNATRPLDWILAGAGLLAALIALGLLAVMLIGDAQAKSQPTTLLTDPTAAPQQTRNALPDAFVVSAGGHDWQLTPKANYNLSARILSHKTYRDWQAPLIPLDLALGWGDMSDTAVDEWINWRQSGRWYHYNWPADSPYTDRDIRPQSANVHIIPANDNLEKALRQLNEDETIALSGYLVDVDVTINGQERHLATSLSRRDGGAGACEVFYVTALVVNGRLYE